ncbi:DUF2442 domain-containing protein [Methylomonas sp. MS20]|uniref:DUF2442 domain-containing protein n=1 Tax=unclassified Methylomonas TaxID=2608980 RepID=UPI0028A3BD13|nr:DUF2442 domain-containing protein [Methylomonas sp. MV1]MDT4329502.1 DUF2442 domain-containing protein [Methylomonas sp. MV1]
MIPEITAVQVLPTYRLLLSYINGERRVFDVTPYLDRGVFVRLKDFNLFAQAYLAFGTVSWPGELDIAPETLYIRSQPQSMAVSPSPDSIDSWVQQ